VTETLKPVGTWLHIGALNLIADAEAGKPVDPAKLELARRLIAELHESRARFDAEAQTDRREA